MILFLSLALNIYSFFFLWRPPPPDSFFLLFYLREQWDMCLCCIFLPLFWLSLCNLFFIYFFVLSNCNQLYCKKKKISCLGRFDTYLIYFWYICDMRYTCYTWYVCDIYVIYIIYKSSQCLFPLFALNSSLKFQSWAWDLKLSLWFQP